MMDGKCPDFKVTISFFDSWPVAAVVKGFVGTVRFLIVPQVLILEPSGLTLFVNRCQRLGPTTVETALCKVESGNDCSSGASAPSQSAQV